MNYFLGKYERNTTWKFMIPDDFSELLKKDGSPKNDVVNFVGILAKKGMDWDVAKYKKLVVLKNSWERVTYIYPEWYWNSRKRESFDNLDVLEIK